VDGTPGSNDMPGRLVFSTTSDNAGSPTERMRLDSSGRLGLGTSGPTANFQVNHTSTAPSLSSFTGSAATFNGTSTIRLSIGTNPAPNYTSWIQSADASGNAYPLLLNPSGGNVGIGTTSPSGKLTVSGNAIGTTVALTDAATVATDLSLANYYTLTLGGNRTLGAPTNQTAGQSGVIVITQDGTGSRTLAYNSVWKFPNGTVPTLTTTASAVDVLAYYVESGTRITARLLSDVK